MCLVAFVVHIANCALRWGELDLLRADWYLGKSVLWSSCVCTHACALQNGEHVWASLRCLP
ncbi:hypothetical protein BX661DRAFT_189385, partial [Kickxella alabastrina]|uniref:uncharacterized protein n=1 Tax=Kickxella alabastrina TaxID=61397 RepID=UPI00221F100E